MCRGGESSLRRGAALGLVLGLTLAASGCVSLLGGLRTAPSGLSWANQELRSMLADGRPGQALATLAGDERGRWVGDELLRLQYRGLVAHYAGRWEESSRALEQAFALSEDRYTKSVTRALLSLVTSDRVLAYEPPRPERLFLHYYGALNYLRRGEPDEAAVEARRLGHLLSQVQEEEDASVPPELGRALSVFAGSVFESAGQSNDAAVAYRRARAFGPDRGNPWAANGPAAGTGTGTGTGTRTGTESGRTGTEPAGRVLVILERGFVAHKVERDLTLFLLPREVRRLHSYRRMAAVDGEAADTAEVLDLAERVAGRSLEDGSHRTFGRRRGIEGEDLVLVRIAWPEFRESTGSLAPATLQVDGRPRDAEPAFQVNLSRAVRRAFRGSRTLKMAKSLVRATAKLTLAEGIEDEVSEENETLGQVLGTAVQVAGALLERADTRSWHLLPDRLDLYLLRLPPGTHRLEARVGTGSGEGTRIPIGPVEVSPGRVQVVTARQWR